MRRIRALLASLKRRPPQIQPLDPREERDLHDHRARRNREKKERNTDA